MRKDLPESPEKGNDCGISFIYIIHARAQNGFFFFFYTVIKSFTLSLAHLYTYPLRFPSICTFLNQKETKIPGRRLNE